MNCICVFHVFASVAVTFISPSGSLPRNTFSSARRKLFRNPAPSRSTELHGVCEELCSKLWQQSCSPASQRVTSLWGDSCGGLQALLTHLSSNLTGWRKQKLPPLIPWPVSCISRGCGAGLQRSSRVAFFRRGLGQAAEKSPLPSCPSSMLCQFDLSL